MEDNSSSNAASTNTGTSGSRDGIVASAEERRISNARYCFLFLLLSAAVVIGAVVYMITNNGEQQDFSSSFENTAEEVINVSNDNVLKVFHALEDIALRTTTFILEEQDDGSEYPPGFVTVPHTEYNLGASRETSQALVLGYVPTVQGKNFELWSVYAEENKDWMIEAWEANPSSSLQAEQEALGAEAALVFPVIWDKRMFDEKGQEIVMNSTACDGTEQVAPARVEQVPEDPKNGPASPIWLLSPPPNPDLPSRENFNMQSDAVFRGAVDIIEEWRTPTFHDICSSTKWFNPAAYPEKVDTLVVAPVFENFDEDAPIVGHYFAVVPWKVFFQDELVEGTDPVIAVVSSTCGRKVTFEINGHEATLLDEDDVHDSAYDHLEMAAPFADFAHDSCQYTISVYPTKTYEATYISSNPWQYMLAVFAIFIFTSLAFLIFDCLIQRRQRRLVATARKQGALVSSLFPKSIQKQLMEDLEETDNKKFRFNKSGTAGLRSYLNDELLESTDPTSRNETSRDKTTKPIADLFPETTIMFADITGFTAWSSTREPSQVFTLLESIYHEFDMIAKRRRVFKVEVVGDCYVAVAGLPDPRKEHAVVMAKFASECLMKMSEVTQSLEVELGPDTADLAIRVGLHSGPVVAGVLRGDKSRFQLFGDTMNTASRMESTGVPNRIQISMETANLLIASGREKWLIPRETKVAAKGKGELSTFFLQIQDSAKGSTVSKNDRKQSQESIASIVEEQKQNRAAEWAVEIMASVLKLMVEVRHAQGIKPDPVETMAALETESLSTNLGSKRTIIDEVAEYIVLPDYCATTKSVNEAGQRDGVALDDTIMVELRSYVQTIASLYNRNPFHNFYHANHVVMSVNKLLNRIRAPDLEIDENGKQLHDHTYGITSDPLTQFACVFSALIHDVDHTGVPNAQLVKENSPIAALYKGKSVAEQNSFDISWDLLMEPAYKNLRRTIYCTASEFKRFRQLVVNSVMATDIVDKDLKKLRNDRWNAAFHGSGASSSSTSEHKDDTVLKATIVIEHLIQASDVAHTMQHWHIYRRWNENFFRECYQAYLDGRAETNPADSWYKGEIGFFDFYIIPLAKKLKECGVFGVSSDEYLSYAEQNRKEWEQRGEEIVQDMIQKVEEQKNGIMVLG